MVSDKRTHNNEGGNSLLPNSELLHPLGQTLFFPLTIIKESEVNSPVALLGRYNSYALGKRLPALNDFP